MPSNEKTTEKRLSWDERYRRGEFSALAPHPLLSGLLAGIPAGRALDLACGAGRHALLLAEKGFRVTALDNSSAGLVIARRKAMEKGLTIDFRTVDLEAADFSLPEMAYDLVCDFFFLHRPLFATAKKAVAPGGRFVAAIHLEGGKKGRFLLGAGELRGFFADFAVEHYRETTATEDEPRPTAEIVARRI